MSTSLLGPHIFQKVAAAVSMLRACDICYAIDSKLYQSGVARQRVPSYLTI
jgi:hypothetical protein